MITELPDRGAFLVTEVTIDQNGEQRHFAPAELTVADHVIELRACDRTVRVPL